MKEYAFIPNNYEIGSRCHLGKSEKKKSRKKDVNETK
jgi:hypothetical protein